MAHQIEQEYKLTAKNEAVLKAIRESALVQKYLISGSVIPVRAFHGRYYDTNDLKLNHLRWSLRARQEGEHWRAALKTGSQLEHGILQCDEYQVDIDSSFSQVADLPESDLKQKLLSQIGTSETLIERVNVKMQRHQCELDIQGVRVEMVTDSGMIYANGRSVTLCEVELEKRSGKLESIQSFIQQLSDEFALRPSTQSKHQLGLSLFDKA